MLLKLPVDCWALFRSVRIIESDAPTFHIPPSPRSLFVGRVPQRSRYGWAIFEESARTHRFSGILQKGEPPNWMGLLHQQGSKRLWHNGIGIKLYCPKGLHFVSFLWTFQLRFGCSISHSPKSEWASCDIFLPGCQKPQIHLSKKELILHGCLDFRNWYAVGIHRVSDVLETVLNFKNKW